MQDVGHVDTKTSQAVAAILNRPQEPDNTQEAEFILDYYKKNYDFVQAVYCQSCGALLCLWILEPQSVKRYMHMHPDGLRRIELGDQLLNTRLRYDGVVGYQCACGANSLVANVEKGYATQSSTHIPADAPHVAALVKRKILATNYKPKVEEIDGNTVIEGFKHVVLKGGVV